MNDGSKEVDSTVSGEGESSQSAQWSIEGGGVRWTLDVGRGSDLLRVGR